MPENRESSRIEQEVAGARKNVQADIAALGDHVRADSAAVKSRVQDSAVAITGGAAALGVLMGVGGKKAIKALLAFGIPAAAAFFYVRQRLGDSAKTPPP